MPAVSRSVEIDVSPKVFYEVVTDFESYPEFLPEVKRVKVLRHEEDVWEAEFEVSMIKTIKYTLELTGKPGKELSWTLKSGFFKKNDGSWKLRSLDKGKRVEATYSVDIEVGMFVPKAIIDKLVEISFPKMLQQFKERAESLA